MQTRTYFASSVPAALDAARRELGPEAALVGSRLAPASMRDLGKREVTFQLESPAPASLQTPPATDNCLSEIRHELHALRKAMGIGTGANPTTEPGAGLVGEPTLLPFGPVPATAPRSSPRSNASFRA